jgi:hypothetical protein
MERGRSRKVPAFCILDVAEFAILARFPFNSVIDFGGNDPIDRSFGSFPVASGPRSAQGLL